MAAKKLTPAQTRKLVERIARELAQAQGMDFTDAALRALLAPSAAYFDERKNAMVDEARLRAELSPLIASATKSARRDERAATVTLGARDDHTGRLVAKRFLANPRPPRRRNLRKDDVRQAMKRAACHFLWFC